MKTTMSLIALGLAAAAAPAAAQTTYTTLAGFQAAAGSTTLETFNSATPTLLAGPGQPTVVGNYTGFQLSTNPNGDYVGIASGTTAGNIDGTNFVYFSQANPTNGQYNGDGGTGPILTFTFGSAITAFAFDWVDTDPTDAYRIDFSGPGFTTIGYANPPFSLNGTGRGFFGFISSSAFTTVTFTQNAAGGVVDPFGIDNIRTNSTFNTGVPEPATWAMMMLGFGAMGAALRRSRKVEARIRFA